MQNQNAPALVEVNATEFSSKFNSKREVSMTFYTADPFFFLGIPFPFIRSQGIPASLPYSHHFPPS